MITIRSFSSFVRLIDSQNWMKNFALIKFSCEYVKYANEYKTPPWSGSGNLNWTIVYGHNRKRRYKAGQEFLYLRISNLRIQVI